MATLEPLTFDTGALISLERERKRIIEVVEIARREKVTIFVPCTAVAEWWRGGRRQEEALNGLQVVSVDKHIAQIAGRALVSVGLGEDERIDSELTIDATVMTVASMLGPNLYTHDIDDMQRFASFFGSVRLFKV